MRVAPGKVARVQLHAMYKQPINKTQPGRRGNSVPRLPLRKKHHTAKYPEKLNEVNRVSCSQGCVRTKKEATMLKKETRRLSAGQTRELAAEQERLRQQLVATKAFETSISSPLCRRDRMMALETPAIAPLDIKLQRILALRLHSAQPRTNHLSNLSFMYQSTRPFTTTRLLPPQPQPQPPRLYGVYSKSGFHGYVARIDSTPDGRESVLTPAVFQPHAPLYQFRSL